MTITYAVSPALERMQKANDMAELLVSVRSLGEAQAALVAGAAVIDVKEPLRGSLGRADDATISALPTH